jgi:hypothetical protein
MTHHDLRQLCAQSTPDDWNVITCWGAYSGPSYLGQVLETTPEEHTFEETHGMRGAYKPDVSVGIAWGYPSNDNWHEAWVENFPDKQASSHFVDFFYNGMLVDREVYISADGGRAYIPLPKIDTLTITQWQYEFFGMLDRLERTSDFDGYLRRAGITIQ